MSDFRSWLATCPRGAEEALQSELAALGAKGLRPRPGLVRFTGPRELALRACLELRCALRVLEPLGDFPLDPQQGAESLYAGARALPWPELVAPGLTIAVSAAGKAPGLDHTQFVGLKVKDAIVDAVRDARGSRPDVDPSSPDVLVIVHLGDGRCSVSLDLAGALLSDRGYRVRSVEAPLREALAAAVVRLSGWDLQRPFHDPVCGSGTLAIEAAGMALGLAPALHRGFACERWPRTQGHDGPALQRLRAELTERAQARRAQGFPEIRATDRDREAVAAAQANVHAAGLEGVVRVGEGDARALAPLVPPGQLVMNVPYGERLDAGGRKQLKSFWHALGAAVKALPPGHRAAVLVPGDEFESAFGMRPVRVLRDLWNGPLRCKLHLYETR